MFFIIIDNNKYTIHKRRQFSESLITNIIEFRLSSLRQISNSNHKLVAMLPLQ